MGLGDQCIDATPPRMLAAGQVVTGNKALCLLALSTFVCLFRSFALYKKLIPGVRDPVDDCLATALRTASADFVSWLLTLADQAIHRRTHGGREFRQVSAGLPIRFRGAERRYS